MNEIVKDGASISTKIRKKTNNACCIVIYLELCKWWLLDSFKKNCEYSTTPHEWLYLPLRFHADLAYSHRLLHEEVILQFVSRE